jgi:hypothetical protein
MNGLPERRTNNQRSALDARAPTGIHQGKRRRRMPPPTAGVSHRTLSPDRRVGGALCPTSDRGRASGAYCAGCAAISDAATDPVFGGGGEDDGDHETVLRGRVCSSDTFLLKECRLGATIRLARLGMVRVTDQVNCRQRRRAGGRVAPRPFRFTGA